MRRYDAAFQTHQSAWRRACREIGAVMATLVADEVVDGFQPESLEDLVRQEVLELP